MTNSSPFSSQADYDQALTLVRQASAAYYSGAPAVMDDATYDELMRQVAASETVYPDWASTGGPVSQMVAAGAAPAGDAVHAAASLSLTNAFGLEDLQSFEETAQKLCREADLAGVEDGWIVEPKLDGLACLLTIRSGHIVRMATRGDGRAGEDITASLPRVAGLPVKLPADVNLELRGEVVMTKAEFARINDVRLAEGFEPYANARNAAAGTLRAKERKIPVQLSFYAYGAEALADASWPPQLPSTDSCSHAQLVEVLNAWGVQCASLATRDVLAGDGLVLRAKTIVEAKTLIDALAQARDALAFDVDGFVVKADSAAVRRACGQTSHSPRWAIAYKLPAEQRLTMLESIEVQVGRTGRITPVAKVVPVLVSGVTVSSATLNNFAHIARLDARVGDWVWVRRAGEVIPEIVAVEMSKRPEGTVVFQAPAQCPRCGSDLDCSHEVWRCPRGRDCGRAESLRWWASRDCMDVEGLGPAAISALLDSGLIQDIPDLYNLTAGEVAALEGFGQASAQALLDQLDKARHRPLDKFVAALGIPMMGRRLASRLVARFGTLDAIRGASPDQLADVDGIGAVKAQALHDGLSQVGGLVDALLAVGVAPVEQDAAISEPAGPLAGKKVCVTGTVPGYSRSGAEDLVRLLGGAPVSSVTKATDLLVAGDGAGSKLAKAQSLGVTTWTAQQLLELVK